LSAMAVRVRFPSRAQIKRKLISIFSQFYRVCAVV
jgi:hypothetical protein